MDDDDEPITIDHLIGVKCVLNASVHVDLRQNRSKDNRLELFSDDSRSCLIVSAITDFTADGGFVVTLSKVNGTVLTNKAVIIAEALFSKKTSKGATI